MNISFLEGAFAFLALTKIFWDIAVFGCVQHDASVAVLGWGGVMYGSVKCLWCFTQWVREVQKRW